MDEEEWLRLVGDVKLAIDRRWLGLYKDVRSAGWEMVSERVRSALERMVTNPALPFQPAEHDRRPLNTLRVADIPALAGLPPATLQRALVALVPARPAKPISFPHAQHPPQRPLKGPRSRVSSMTSGLSPRKSRPAARGASSPVC
jgi:hypothetical protein